MNELDAKKQQMEQEMDDVIQQKIYADGVTRLNDELREKMLTIFSTCKDMTISTVRPDGWPQANIVGFVNRGLTLYFETYKTASKTKNIERDPRVSMTFSVPYTHLSEVKAISMAAHAEVVTDESEIKEFHRLVLERFPELAEMTYDNGEKVYPDPTLVQFRLRPEVASIMDFSKSIGYAALVPFDDERAK